MPDPADDLEALVLDGLEKHLMDPELTEVFCRHYTETMNRLVTDHNAGLHGKRAELGKVQREIEKLVQAILDGVPGAEVKDKMAELQARKETLEQQVESAEEMPVLLHPNLASYYREQIGQLRLALSDETMRGKATEAIRALIDRIELTSVEREGKRVPAINLQGKLAGILALAAPEPALRGRDALAEASIKLVAGVGFAPPQFARGLSPVLNLRARIDPPDQFLNALSLHVMSAPDGRSSNLHGHRLKPVPEPHKAPDWGLCVVAGVGFEPTTFRL